MRWILYFCLIVLTPYTAVYAQQDTTTAVTDSVKPKRPRFNGPLPFLDSVARATAIQQKHEADSIAMIYVLRPSPDAPNLFVDSILKSNAYNGKHYLDITGRSRSIQGYGHARPSRDGWVIAVIIALLLFISGLNILSSKDMSNIFQSFYNRRSISKAGKEESPINTWTFIGLFLLFGFTFGIFLYLLTTGYYKVYYTVGGVQLFVTLSVVIISLFAIKFMVLKFLGFVFDINKLASEYITALSLTYFNITFVLLPVALCFSLISDKFIPYLLAVTLLLVVVIFIWQYLRSSVGIISNFRFHKFYLIVYLCALEICPILILIKALNIGFR
jgi:hypothetical protein